VSPNNPQSPNNNEHEQLYRRTMAWVTVGTSEVAQVINDTSRTIDRIVMKVKDLVEEAGHLDLLDVSLVDRGAYIALAEELSEIHRRLNLCYFIAAPTADKAKAELRAYQAQAKEVEGN
jgi:hypothetical protein